jgi:bifunctional DNase/RNase
MTIRPGILLGVMLVAAAGCGNGGGVARGASGTGQVRVEVANVGFDEGSGSHYVMLADQRGGRTLPIVVGDDEARAIMFELHGVKPGRPLTYELLLDVIAATGNKVDRVAIDDVHDEIYYAHISLDHGRYVIDSRPSDAIAIAMGVKAPIFVAARLFGPGNLSASTGAAEIKTVSRMGITVQALSADLGDYFGLQPQSGVVVADIRAEGGKGGIERGDIITQVEGRGVTTIDEFSRVMATLHPGSPVTLTIRRGHATRVVTLGVPMAGGPASSPTPSPALP